jgi:hypothetical protein
LFPGDGQGGKNPLIEVLANARTPPIFFLGVWDTVGSLGVPFGPLRMFTMRKYAFHDTDLSGSVTYAYQALAIDERRGVFTPTLWTRPKERAEIAPQTLQQVWFAGCHSNIGGGYDESGLSDISFLWMASKARDAVDARGHAPLAFDETLLDTIDKKSMGTLVNSRSGFWYLLPRFVRRLMDGNTDDKKETLERIHESVLSRYKKSGTGAFKPNKYRPKNAKRLLASIDAAIIEKASDFEKKYGPTYTARQ